MKKTLYSVIPAQRGNLTDAMLIAILYGTMGNEINAQQRATELSKEFGCPFLVIGLLTETSVSISSRPFGSTSQFSPAILSEGYTIESESYIPSPYHIFHVIGKESIGANVIAQSRQYVGTVLAISETEALIKAQLGSWAQKSNSMLTPTDRQTTVGDIIFCPTGTAFMVNSLYPASLKEVTTYFQQVHGSQLSNPHFFTPLYNGGNGSEGSGSGSGTGTNTGSSQYQPQFGQYPQQGYQPGSQYQPSQGGSWQPSQTLGNGNGNGNGGFDKVNYGMPQFEYSVRQTQIPGGTQFEIVRRTVFSPDPNNREWTEPRNYTPFQIKNGRFTRTGHGWLFYQEGETVSSKVVNSLRQGIVPTEFIETLPEGGQCIYISHLSQVPTTGVNA